MSVWFLIEVLDPAGRSEITVRSAEWVMERAHLEEIREGLWAQGFDTFEELGEFATREEAEKEKRRLEWGEEEQEEKEDPPESNKEYKPFWLP